MDSYIVCTLCISNKDLAIICHVCCITFTYVRVKIVNNLKVKTLLNRENKPVLPMGAI